jgi:hypothetical protein
MVSCVAPPPAVLQALSAIKAAAAAAPAEWQEWYSTCIGGVVVFIATIFVMRGRWSPRRRAPTKQRTTRRWRASFAPCREAKSTLRIIVGGPSNPGYK